MPILHQNCTIYGVEISIVAAEITSMKIAKKFIRPTVDIRPCNRHVKYCFNHSKAEVGLSAQMKVM